MMFVNVGGARAQDQPGKEDIEVLEDFGGQGGR
jgi:hypothetical protein